MASLFVLTQPVFRRCGLVALLLVLVAAFSSVKRTEALVTAMRLTGLRPGSTGPEAFYDNDWETVYPSGCFSAGSQGDWSKCSCNCVRTTSGEDVFDHKFCYARMEPLCGHNATHPGDWCSMFVDVEAEMDTKGSDSSYPVRLVESADPIYFMRLVSKAKYTSKAPYKVKWTYQVGVATALGQGGSWQGEKLVTFTAFQGTQTPGVSISTSVECNPSEVVTPKVTVTDIKANCKTGDVDITMDVQGCPALYDSYWTFGDALHNIHLFDGRVESGVKHFGSWEEFRMVSLYPNYEDRSDKLMRVLRTDKPGVVKASIKRGEAEPWPDGLKSIKVGIRYMNHYRGYWDNSDGQYSWVPPVQEPDKWDTYDFDISTVSATFTGKCNRRLQA